jgi:hypothetical protein
VETIEGEPSSAGGCHCGDVRFVVRGRPERLLACNCSICSKKGFLHFIIGKERFTLLTPEEHLGRYTFGTHTAQHLFCRRCGISSFYLPRSHPDGVSVNARCLDDVDVDALLIEPFDGQHWEASMERLRARAADETH